MAKNNPSNPYTSDPNNTSKDVQMPLSRAKVVNVGASDEDGFHTVRIKIYGEGSSYLAPVLTPMIGSIWVPSKGEDVAVLFDAGDNAWVIGSWYALDRVDNGDVDLPSYDVGDIRLGNRSGSHATVHNDGHISIETDGNERVDIDCQKASVEKTQSQSISGDDTFQKVTFDTEKYDDVDLFDTDSFVLLNDGTYNVSGTIMFPSAGQNNRYIIGLFKNGDLIKRKARQSIVNQELSLDIDYNGKFDIDDEITLQIKQDSGSTKDISGDPTTNDFTIRRDGI